MSIKKYVVTIFSIISIKIQKSSIIDPTLLAFYTSYSRHLLYTKFLSLTFFKKKITIIKRQASSHSTIKGKLIKFFMYQKNRISFPLIVEWAQLVTRWLIQGCAFFWALIEVGFRIAHAEEFETLKTLFRRIHSDLFRRIPTGPSLLYLGLLFLTAFLVVVLYYIGAMILIKSGGPPR